MRDPEHTELARAIHRAGTTDPDSLAEYLIREGWYRARSGGYVFEPGAIVINQHLADDPITVANQVIRAGRQIDRNPS